MLCLRFVDVALAIADPAIDSYAAGYLKGRRIRIPGLKSRNAVGAFIENGEKAISEK